MRNKEKDDRIYNMLGVSKWYKWKVRLEVSLCYIGIIMIGWSVLFGICAMGYKTFWLSILIIAFLELSRAAVVHIYYLITWEIKKKRKRKNTLVR